MEKKLKRHFILVPVILAFVLTIVGQLLGLIIVNPLSRLARNSAEVFLLQYFSFIGIWIVFILYMFFLERPILKNILPARKGGGKGNTLKAIVIGLFIGFGMNLICAFIAILNKDIKLTFAEIDIAYLLLALLVVIVQSGAEELAMRVYLFQTIRERYGFWIALLVNAVYFGALHLANTGFTAVSMLSIVAIAVFFTLIMQCFDSFWMVTMIHAGWNFMQNFILGLPNSGIVSEKSVFFLEAARDSFFYSSAFGIEGAWPAVIVCVLASGLFLWKFGLKAKETA